MADDFEMSELWPIGEIADHLPRLPGGSKHATSKVYVWLNLSNDPTRKTLRSVVVGRYRYSSDRWLAEFLESSKPVGGTTPGQRDRRRARVKAELAKAGI